MCFTGIGNAQVVGTVDDYGIPTLTFNQTELLANWNDHLLTAANIDAGLTQVSIVKRDARYLLIATGNGYKSTAHLSLNGQTNELQLRLNVGGGKTTCTTKSCAKSYGCEVTDQGYCSPCDVSHGGVIVQSDCTKTTSSAGYLF